MSIHEHSPDTIENSQREGYTDYSEKDMLEYCRRWNTGPHFTRARMEYSRGRLGPYRYIKLTEVAL